MVGLRLGRSGIRALLAAATALVSLVALTGCGSEASTTTPATPLRILLVSSDGWASPGVVTLREALRRAGHTVVQVSPLADRSTSGTALTMAPTEISVAQPSRDPEVWATSGTGTDATEIGLRAVMGSAAPALVIAGIDPRPNVGVAALHSGTVGAAFTAAELGYPAIAISTAVPDPARPPAGAFDACAQFVVRLVQALEERPAGAILMPLHTVLNVNYPLGQPRHVVSTTTSDVPATTVSFHPGSRPGMYVAVSSPSASTGKSDDVEALEAGDVTLTDFSADPDRTEPPPRTAARLAPVLTP